MDKWEYKLVTRTEIDRFHEGVLESMAERLTVLGKQGWELIIFDSGIYYFKRKIN